METEEKQHFEMSLYGGDYGAGWLLHCNYQVVLVQIAYVWEELVSFRSESSFPNYYLLVFQSLTYPYQNWGAIVVGTEQI